MAIQTVMCCVPKKKLKEKNFIDRPLNCCICHQFVPLNKSVYITATSPIRSVMKSRSSKKADDKQLSKMGDNENVTYIRSPILDRCQKKNIKLLSIKHETGRYFDYEQYRSMKLQTKAKTNS